MPTRTACLVAFMLTVHGALAAAESDPVVAHRQAMWRAHPVGKQQRSDPTPEHRERPGFAAANYATRRPPAFPRKSRGTRSAKTTSSATAPAP